MLSEADFFMARLVVGPVLTVLATGVDPPDGDTNIARKKGTAKFDIVSFHQTLFSLKFRGDQTKYFTLTIHYSVFYLRIQ